MYCRNGALSVTYRSGKYLLNKVYLHVPILVNLPFIVYQCHRFKITIFSNFTQKCSGSNTKNSNYKWRNT